VINSTEFSDQNAYLYLILFKKIAYHKKNKKLLIRIRINSQNNFQIGHYITNFQPLIIGDEIYDIRLWKVINLQKNFIIIEEVLIKPSSEYIFIESKTVFDKIDLIDQKISEKNILLIVDKIIVNDIITYLSLSNCQISSKAAEILFHVLEKNKTITNVDLSTNNIGIEGCLYLSKALVTNNHIKQLDIGDNFIREKGCNLIFKSLFINKEITHLFLYENNICFSVKNDIEFFKYNSRLSVLDLGYNNIRDSDAKLIAKYSNNNKSLTKLYLNNNKIGEEGSNHLAASLKRNLTLTQFSLTENKYLDAQQLINSLKKNDTLYSLCFKNSKYNKNQIKKLINKFKNQNIKDKIKEIITTENIPEDY
jgi:Ran GTPase-activating protein (RanGAP) involved in mRNA processing and transport